MRVIDPGHRYRLDNLKLDGTTILDFYKDYTINGDDQEGVSNQEVLRALIDRVKFLNQQVPDKVNNKIIYHLRSALALHETRHIHRLIEKGVAIEDIPTARDGHILNKK